MRASIAVLASVLLVGCQLASPTSPSAPSSAGIRASPTPCFDALQCPATPGPIRTLPPVPTPPPGPTSGTSAETFRIAVGACLRYSPGGTALEDIALQKPDLMVWLGDNIYADTRDMSVMRGIYDSLAANPRFQALSAAAADTMAIWDDHDYGANNANKNWPLKDAAKDEFLRFWGATPDDPRWTQPGVYSARTFGSGERTIQVILLDNRYNLDPWDYGGKDPNRDVLGEVQWAWLRDRLAEPATVRIIGSGVQVVQNYDLNVQWEGWGDSPFARERLFRLIREMGVPGVVFVSGDMHFAELTRAVDDGATLGYPTYDLTPSGLDQIEFDGVLEDWVNPGRVGELLNKARKHGMVEVDWAPADPEIHLEIYDGRDLFVHHVVRLSELQPGA
jgi:alkaline phosphatase D